MLGEEKIMSAVSIRPTWETGIVTHSDGEQFRGGRTIFLNDSAQDK